MSNQLLNKLLGFDVDHQIVIKVNRERRNKNGKKSKYCKGIILSWKMKADDGKEYVLCGHSFCDNKDRFDREVAYKLAIARGIKRFSSNSYEIPNSMEVEFDRMIERMETYYKDSNFPRWFTKKGDISAEQ